MNAGGLGAPQQRPHVLGIFERIEGEHEWRLRPLDAPGEDLLQGGEAAGTDDEGDPLVTVEPGNRGERAAFDFDDRDAEARGVKHETLERLAALGDDEQPHRRPLGHERLLDWAAARDELLAFLEEVVHGRRRSTIAELGRFVLPAGRPRPRRTGARSRAGAGPRVRRARPGERRAGP
jgi:hypothetical protein